MNNQTDAEREQPKSVNREMTDNEFLAIELNLEITSNQDPWSFAGEVIEAIRERSMKMQSKFNHQILLTGIGHNWFVGLTPQAIAKAARAALEGEK